MAAAQDPLRLMKDGVGSQVDAEAADQQRRDDDGSHDQEHPARPYRRRRGGAAPSGGAPPLLSVPVVQTVRAQQLRHAATLTSEPGGATKKSRASMGRAL